MSAVSSEVLHHVWEFLAIGLITTVAAVLCVRIWLRNRETRCSARCAQFETAIDNLSQGVVLFSERREVVFCNRGYRELYRLSADQVKPGTPTKRLIERRLELGWKVGADPAIYAQQRATGPIVAANAIHEFADGRIIAYAVRPMPSGGGIATHEDITEREALQGRVLEQDKAAKEQQEQIRLRNIQLDAALDNMSDGLCVFDNSQRLIVCNKRYIEICNLRPGSISAGMTLREIIYLRHQAGSLPESSPDDFYNSRSAVSGSDEPSDTIVKLKNGRIVAIHYRPMPNGCWVATHKDITEREELHAQIKQQLEIVKGQQEQLRVRNWQFDMAINNILHGLCFFDGEERLIIANNRYVEMYGLDPAAVRPGISLREIIALRHRAGSFPSMAQEEYHAWRRAVAASPSEEPTVVELANGRIFEIHHRPMPGGGWVATHEDITLQRQAEAKIAHMAHHDALTGLANRALLNERLERALAQAAKGENVALHLLDLDHFKAVNDTLGHPAGDLLLAGVADRLRSLVREGDTVARIGGDEFAILQVGVEQPAGAAALAQRIVDVVSKPYQLDGDRAMVGTSIGIAFGSPEGTTQERLALNADLALYNAKSDGRGAFRFFEEGMDAQMVDRRAMECDLRAALQAGAFELYYQPMISARHGGIVGFEAFIHWNHPEKGLLPPDVFLPLADELGLTAPLGAWAIRQACATAVQWPGELPVAVNIQPEQFRAPGLALSVIEAIASSGLAARRLELEISEAALSAYGEAASATITQLRGFGVRIVLDQFGAGASSLNYLRRYRFDKLKIHESFMQTVAALPDSAHIVRGIAAIARDSGMSSAVEGVDTAEQRAQAGSEGCIEVQGKVLGGPVRACEIEALLRASATPDEEPHRRQARA